MKLKTMLGATALLSTIGISQAFAAIFDIPAPIPEIDSGAGIAAVALLVSVAAILFGRMRNR